MSGNHRVLGTDLGHCTAPSTWRLSSYITPSLGGCEQSSPTVWTSHSLLDNCTVDAEIMKVYVILFVVGVTAVAFCQGQNPPAPRPAPMPEPRPAPMPVPRPPPVQPVPMPMPQQPRYPRPVPTWRFKRSPEPAAAGVRKVVAVVPHPEQ